MSTANPQQMNRFVQVVDDFMKRYALLTSDATRKRVFDTNDAALINDYNTQVSRGKALKATIEGTVGAWNAAKREWSKITDATSTAIGDAVDEIRSWFGYKPAGDLSGYGNLAGLGALQIPAAAWVAGIITAAVLATKAIDEILVRIEATRIQQETGKPRAQALSEAKDIYRNALFADPLQIPKLLLIAGGLYYLIAVRKK